MFAFGIKADHFLLTAQLLEKQKRLPIMKKVLGIALRFPFKSDICKLKFTKMYLAASEFDSALQLINQIHANDDDFDTSMMRLDIYLENLLFDNFNDLAKQLNSKYKKVPDLDCRIANGYYKQGQHEEAMAIAVNIKDGSEKTNIQRDRILALLYFYAGNYTKSEELAQTFKDMTKTDYRHYYSHYYFFLRQGNINNAMGLLKDRNIRRFRSSLLDKPSAHTVSDLKGKTVYVVPEQGIGDRIEWARFFKRATEMGITLQIRQIDKLNRLFSSFDNPPFQTPSKVNADEVDATVYLAELPALLNLTQKKDFSSSPYLTAEPEFVERWAKRIDRSKPVIAIAWKGSDNGSHDFNRSIPLAAFEPLLKRTDITIISLQIGKALSQIDDLPSDQRPTVYPDLDSTKDAYVDTAGLLMNVDMVVTPDTSMAHIAGALGVETAVLLGKYPDLRWLQDERPDFLYPGQNVIFQKEFGDWSHNMNALNKLIDKKFF